MPDSKELVDVLGLAPLERHALLSARLESREGRRQVFTSYLALREKIAITFLPLVKSAVPYLNDHSRGHLERVLSHIESILVTNFPRRDSAVGDIPSDRVITWADTAILLNALVWHDIGNVYGRDGHAAQAHWFLSAIASHLYDPHLRDYIVQVAEAHSGPKAITEKIPTGQDAISYLGEAVHLRFLAAVLRFADEIDEDYRRAEPHDWDDLHLIPAGSQRFWYFAKCNSSIRVVASATERNWSFHVAVDSHVPSSEFDRSFEAEHGQVRALTEYFRRLLKFERERVYCNQYISPAYYHPGIGGFKVNLRTHEMNQPPHTARTLSFELSDERPIQALIADSNLGLLQPYMTEALQLGY